MSPLCAATGCTNPVPTSGRPGRPAIYCTPDCRPSRKPGTRPRPAQPPLTVELADINNETNPPGRNPKNWAIRLRRGVVCLSKCRSLGWKYP